MISYIKHVGKTWLGPSVPHGIDSGPFSGSSLVAWAGVEVPAWAEKTGSLSQLESWPKGWEMGLSWAPFHIVSRLHPGVFPVDTKTCYLKTQVTNMGQEQGFKREEWKLSVS